MEPRNRFHGIDSASLCSLAGRYDNPVPTRFLAPKGCLKIPALAACVCRETAGVDKRADLARLLWFSDDICFSIICYFATAVGDDSSSPLSGLWHIAADAAMPLQLPWKYRSCSSSSPLLQLSSAKKPIRAGHTQTLPSLWDGLSVRSVWCERGGGEKVGQLSWACKAVDPGDRTSLPGSSYFGRIAQKQ